MKRATKRTSIRVVAIGATSLIAACCLFDVGPFPGPPLPTIDGPEEPALLAGTSGTLVVLDREDASHLRIVRLPNLDERTIDVVGDARDVSGPDVEGRVAYVQTKHERDRWTYALRCVSIADGSDRLLLARNGSLNPSIWLALAPSGGLIAFTSSIDRGGYDYSPWVLEIIDVATGESKLIDGTITQHRPCWFQDGRRLAFVERRAADGIVVTSVLDVPSGERRVVREAPSDSEFLAAVSADGSALLFESRSAMLRVDVQSGRVVDFGPSLPGALAIVADLGAGKFLGDALPTTGVEQKLRAGFMWPNDIKLGDVRSGKFVTVVSQLWGTASYGTFESSR